MPSLFDLGQELLHLRHVLEMENDGEIDPALEAWLCSTEGALEEKVERYCGVIGELEGVAEARAKEADRVKQLASFDAAKAKRMRVVLLTTLQKLGIERMETLRYKLRLQRAGGKQSLAVDPFESVPPEYTKTIVETDMDKVRRTLESGQELPFAKLLPRNTILVIK